jgi:hypothetical protein
MSSLPRKSKTYQVVTQAGAASIRPVPENPHRIGLFIQNTSANPGLVHLGAATAMNGSDILFAAGQIVRWDQGDTCPVEGVNFSSTLQVTWCVIETIDVRGG